MDADRPVQYYLDGPERLSNALQIVSSVISSSIPRSSSPSPSDDPLTLSSVSTTIPDSVTNCHPNPSLNSSITVYNSVKSMEQSDQREGPISQEHIHQPTNSSAKTIVAADNEVSNGFVKDGNHLPYVFEASETGARKRTSKILPVCGVCGKRFVCVTTMKRHLVTHTGEKPFACKICGKQYTQKGNLRVHERTHRNDRPFECNICHQKFYRKEPMQKHQWRQHGIVHFKSRPIVGNQPTSQPQANDVNTTSSIEVQASVNCQDTANSTKLPVFYNNIVDRIRNNSLELMNESSRHLNNAPTLYSTSSNASFTVLSRSRDELSYQSIDKNEELSSGQDVILDNCDFSSRIAPPAHTAQPETNSSASLNTCIDNTNESSSPTTNEITDHDRKTSPTEGSSSSLSSSPNNHLLDCSIKNNLPENHDLADQSRPINRKKALAHAYQKEIEERDHSETSSGQSTLPDASKDKEQVECQCKACGTIFVVNDPYNFRCGHCNTKYSSLPTHMIADPLQCIGCVQVFPHKPALKAHQSCTNDVERPFRCCICSYGFRQKAHLQKHQWRIHRRKLETDSCTKEAEIFLQSLDNRSSTSFANEEQSLKEACDSSSPLDLSPIKTHHSKPTCNNIQESSQNNCNEGSLLNLVIRSEEGQENCKRQRTDQEQDFSSFHNTLPPIAPTLSDSRASIIRQKTTASWLTYANLDKSDKNPDCNRDEDIYALDMTSRSSDSKPQTSVSTLVKSDIMQRMRRQEVRTV